MDTAFIIGNGESRNIFPIEELKGHGQVWGCNAIYRDHPLLCDHIVAVNPPMYEELKAWHNNGKAGVSCPKAGMLASCSNSRLPIGAELHDCRNS